MKKTSNIRCRHCGKHLTSFIDQIRHICPVQCRVKWNPGHNKKSKEDVAKAIYKAARIIK